MPFLAPWNASAGRNPSIFTGSAGRALADSNPGKLCGHEERMQALVSEREACVCAMKGGTHQVGFEDGVRQACTREERAERQTRAQKKAHAIGRRHRTGKGGRRRGRVLVGYDLDMTWTMGRGRLSVVAKPCALHRQPFCIVGSCLQIGVRGVLSNFEDMQRPVTLSGACE